MHSFGREAELGSFDLAFFEELVEEGAAIALEIAKARDEAGQAPRVFDCKLDEFSVLQERVHARVVGLRGNGRGLRRDEHNCET